MRILNTVLCCHAFKYAVHMLYYTSCSFICKRKWSTTLCILCINWKWHLIVQIPQFDVILQINWSFCKQKHIVRSKKPCVITWSTSFRTAISCETAHPNSWKDLEVKINKIQKWLCAFFHGRMMLHNDVASKACFLLCSGSHPPGARGDVTAVAGSAGAIFGQRDLL